MAAMRDASLTSRAVPESVAAAADYLVERGFYGAIWLLPDLTVQAREGALVADVVPGLHVADSLPQLTGLDEQIQALRRDPLKSLELGNVALVGPEGAGRRLNFYVHWHGGRQQFLVIVARTTNQEALEAELETQSRRTALAEKALVEQAKEIERANVELTRANRELTEFAYVISHDLRAPMRGLRYQIEDLQKALGPALGEGAQALVGEIKAQTRRMSRMLGDLLLYARLGRVEEAIEPVDTRAMIEAIVASLPRPKGLAVRSTGDWPRIEAAGAALDLALRNLIDNAIKHHDRPEGQIEIGARELPGALELTVADDGPGIPRKFHDTVFHPFRKLAGEDEGAKEGSGIGLSLVRKTVEANGARLELFSDPDARRGTTFRLTWPCRIVA